jgi:hypothetical protein
VKQIVHFRENLFPGRRMWYGRKKGARAQGPGFRKEMKKKLKKYIDAIDGLNMKTAASGEFVRWRRQTEETLKALYGEESAEVQDFNAIYYSPVFLTCRMGDEAFDEAYRNGLDEARVLLLSLGGKVTQD